MRRIRKCGSPLFLSFLGKFCLSIYSPELLIAETLTSWRALQKSSFGELIYYCLGAFILNTPFRTLPSPICGAWADSGGKRITCPEVKVTILE